MADIDVGRAAELVAASTDLVVFTGAGVSTASGIPDFRSPGGIWDRYDPADFTIDALLADPVAYWETRLEMEQNRDFEWGEVEPNPAHDSIAQLETDGPLSITQNVDGLHQAAGNSSENVLELHGTYQAAKCLGCERQFPGENLKSKLETDHFHHDVITAMGS